MYAQRNAPLMTYGRFLNCVHTKQPLHLLSKHGFIAKTGLLLLDLPYNTFRS